MKSDRYEANGNFKVALAVTKVEITMCLRASYKYAAQKKDTEQIVG